MKQEETVPTHREPTVIECSKYCGTTAAMLAVMDPGRHASALIDCGVFTCEHVVGVKENRKNSLKWATLLGITEIIDRRNVRNFYSNPISRYSCQGVGPSAAHRTPCRREY